MEEKQENTPQDIAKDAETDEVEEEILNFHEVIQLEEILGNSGSNEVKMLDFERQMFLDCVYNDGLVICGK